ncbi:FAD-binding oxidoreductase [Nocardia sp. CA-135398]|uniref:FAD-binding oxidoreductase n=1 Tax=Nocardia sp. CA-135398 TaxID=3239977 RepID=UPI003D97A675
MTTSVHTRLLDELSEIVGPPNVLTDPELIAGHVTDWTGRWSGHTSAVVRPASTAEVAGVLTACARWGVAVVPQGGNTGLVGGSIPMDGEIVLSLRRLSTIEEVDPVARTLAAGAGVTVAQAQRAAREVGLDFGIDLASRDTATLGGILATNAGGIRMIKYGNTRRQLLGVEAVLSDGQVLTRWKKLVKDNVGYDIPGLLAGSEGTLAVVTRVMMKLIVPAPIRHVALVGVASVDHALSVVAAFERAGLTIEAAEFMTDAGVDLIVGADALRAPLSVPAPFFLLAEVSGVGDAEATLLDTLAEMSPAVLDAIVEPAPAQKLWRYREAHTEVAAKVSTTPPIKLDLAAPLPAVGLFLDELGTTLAQRYPAVRAVCFGHIGDGNVHVNLIDVPYELERAITETVLRLVTGYGGSISAEHGIGRLKVEWIDLSRTSHDIELMRAIRRTLDPDIRLNPAILPK